VAVEVTEVTLCGVNSCDSMRISTTCKNLDYYFSSLCEAEFAGANPLKLLNSSAGLTASLPTGVLFQYGKLGLRFTD
jgi:hypothetical protein